MVCKAIRKALWGRQGRCVESLLGKKDVRSIQGDAMAHDKQVHLLYISHIHSFI